MGKAFISALELYLFLLDKYGDRLKFYNISSNITNEIIGEIDGYPFEIRYKRATFFNIQASSEILDELEAYLLEAVDFNKFPIYEETITNNKVYKKLHM